jgi:hypothetical protein
MARLLLFTVMRSLIKMTLFQYKKRPFVFKRRRLLFSTRQTSWKERPLTQHRIAREKLERLPFERQPRSSDGLPRAGLALGEHAIQTERRGIRDRPPSPC